MNCIRQRIAQQGNRSLWNVDHFVSTAKSCINVVSTVKYSKKGNVKFLSQWAHESELRKTYIHFVEISILIHARVKFVAQDD